MMEITSVDQELENDKKSWEVVKEAINNIIADIDHEIGEISTEERDDKQKKLTYSWAAVQKALQELIYVPSTNDDIDHVMHINSEMAITSVGFNKKSPNIFSILVPFRDHNNKYLPADTDPGITSKLNEILNRHSGTDKIIFMQKGRKYDEGRILCAQMVFKINPMVVDSIKDRVIEYRSKKS